MLPHTLLLTTLHEREGGSTGLLPYVIDQGAKVQRQETTAPKLHNKERHVPGLRLGVSVASSNVLFPTQCSLLTQHLKVPIS